MERLRVEDALKRKYPESIYFVITADGEGLAAYAPRERTVKILNFGGVYRPAPRE